MLFGQLRGKVILCGAGQICYPFEVAVLLELAGTPCHDIGVKVDGVYRVGDGHSVSEAEDFLDIAAVAFGAIADKDFISAEVQPIGLVIVFENGFCQEAVALFRAISPEGSGVGHFVHSLVHGFYAGRGQGPGHIAYPQADDISFRMELLIGCHPAAYFSEQIAAGEL